MFVYVRLYTDMTLGLSQYGKTQTEDITEYCVEEDLTL